MQNSTGRRERRRERVRGELLDAAMALFAEKGLHGTRVEDVTERADLGKGAFYNYFESKDALIGELLLMGIDRLEREYLSDLAAGGAMPERLEMLVRKHDQFFEEHPEYVVLFHQARGLLQTQPGDPPRLRRIFADYLDRIGAKLAPSGAADPEGQARRADVAALIVGAIAGYRSYRLAAGLRPETATIAGALSAGVPALMLRLGPAGG